MKRFSLLLSLLFVASTAFAGEVLIPAVYRGAGANGTQWRTEIAISNIAGPYTTPVQTTITLHRDNGETHEVRMPLAPMEVIQVEDALFGWYSIESGGGIVRVTWADAPNSRIVARARVYNVGEHGQYGQPVPGIDVVNMPTQHNLIGLSGVDGNRTNVGISNPHTVDAMVFVSLYDTSGSERGGFATVIPARSVRQYNDIFSAFQTGPLHAALVRVSSWNVPIYAYASIVRNDTGDATFVTTP